MPQVTIYTTDFCGYCTRALKLLERKGVTYRQIRIDDDPEQRDIMIDRSGRYTVPQIFIDERPIGGYDDMALLDLDGELDRLLDL